MSELKTHVLAKVQESATGCWEWTGAMSSNGYGQMERGGKHQYAHRVSYEAHRGPIPEGLTIDHLCRNRACVNPAHLEAVTNEENIRRGMWPSAVNRRKTHCAKGHPYDGDNLYTNPNTKKRYCRACMKAYDQRRQNGWARSQERSLNKGLTPDVEEAA